MARFLLAALTSGLLVTSIAARTPQPPQDPTPATFVGPDACKGCHAEQYASWSETKHARAASALSGDELKKEACIKCHATGAPEKIGTEGSLPGNRHVQCEACHGAGSNHVAAAKGGDAKTARTEEISERTCTRCHCQESPHFKYFFYDGMKSFVHPKRSH